MGHGGRVVYLPKEYCDKINLIKGDIVMITDNRDGTLELQKGGAIQYPQPEYK